MKSTKNSIDLDSLSYAEQRTKGFGSSDAKMIYRLSNTNKITDYDKKRLAILLGLDVAKEIKTEAMQRGIDIENALFECIKKEHPTAESNKVIVSKALSTDKFTCWTRPDIFIENETDVIFWECKASIKTVNALYKEYNDQLRWHSAVGREYATKVKKRFSLYLCAYDTTDFDGEINVEKLTINNITFPIKNNLIKGVECIYNVLNYFEYKPSEDVFMESTSLPQTLQNDLAKIERLFELEENTYVIEYLALKKAEKEVKDAFYKIMCEQNIETPLNFVDLGKKFTLKKPYTKVDFNIEAFKAKHPKLYENFKTTKEVKGSCLISKIKDL